MSAPLRKEDIDALYSAPPALDWTAAFSVIDSMRDLERFVSRLESETTTWLSGLTKDADRGNALFLEKMAALPRADARDLALPALDQVLTAVDSAIATHAVPFHEQDFARETFNKLRVVSGGPGRFMRKQVNRIEDVRVKRHNRLVDIYYALLAVRAKIENDETEGKAFSDPKALGDFLRNQVG